MPAGLLAHDREHVDGRLDVAVQPRPVRQHDVDLVGAGGERRPAVTAATPSAGSVPAGKLTTVATRTPLPARRPAHGSTNAGHTHTAATAAAAARSQSAAAASAVVSAPRSVRSSSAMARRATAASVAGHPIPSSARNASLLGGRPRKSSSISVAGTEPPCSRIAVR